jgi:hypothetical protein
MKNSQKVFFLFLILLSFWRCVKLERTPAHFLPVIITQADDGQLQKGVPRKLY